MTCAVVRSVRSLAVLGLPMPYSQRAWSFVILHSPFVLGSPQPLRRLRTVYSCLEHNLLITSGHFWCAVELEKHFLQQSISGLKDSQIALLIGLVTSIDTISVHSQPACEGKISYLVKSFQDTAGVMDDLLCPFCDFTDKDSYFLLQHVELIHPENGESPFIVREDDRPSRAYHGEDEETAQGDEERPFSPIQMKVNTSNVLTIVESLSPALSYPITKAFMSPKEWLSQKLGYPLRRSCRQPLAMTLKQ